MAFDRAGFTAAAKSMGYSDDEINAIAIMKESQQKSQAIAPPTRNVIPSPTTTQTIQQPVAPQVNTQRPSLTGAIEDVPDIQDYSTQISKSSSEDQVRGGNWMTNFGNKALDVGKAIIAAPSKLGASYGKAISYNREKGELDTVVKDQQAIMDKNNALISKYMAQGNMKGANSLIEINKRITQDMRDIAGEQRSLGEKGSKIEEDAKKGSVGTAAFFVPGGKALSAKVALGATTGGMMGYGASEKGQELPSIVTGAVLGGAMPVAFNLLGKAINPLKNMAKEKINSKVLNRLMQTTNKDVEDLIVKKGKVPEDFAKYIKDGSSYDDMLGAPKDKGNGGYFGKLIKSAESKIMSFAKSRTGKSIKIYADDIIPMLDDQIDELSSISGNEAKIKVLQEAKKEIAKNYANGRSVEQALKTLRLGNKTFGANAALTSKEAARVATQKLETNAVRSWLKQFTPIQEALKTQEDIYTIKPIMEGARSKFLRTGVVGKPETLSSLTKKSAEGIPFVSNIYNIAADWVDNIKFGTPQAATSRITSQPNIIQKALSKTAGLPDIISKQGDKFTKPIMAGLLNSASNPQKKSVDEVQSHPNSVNQEQTANDVNSQTDHTLPSITQTPPAAKNYVTGYSPEEWMNAKIKADSEGDTKASDVYLENYKNEAAYQKQIGRGKTLYTPTQLKELSDIQNSIDLMNKLEPVLIEKENLFGPVKGLQGMNPYATEAKSLEAQFRAAAQLVGKAMEGGVLRKEDEIKYRKMLPQITDLPDVARNKINNVRDMVQMQLDTKRDFYSNYDVNDTSSVTQ